MKLNICYYLTKILQPAAFGRLCVETSIRNRTGTTVVPAAFGRLCVETTINTYSMMSYGQPPSGGCVLKPDEWLKAESPVFQPPSGGCVLKHSYRLNLDPPC